MSELWDLIDENLQQVTEPQEIGASTATPPAVHGESDPGDIYRYGPNFVRFVHDRFAAVEVMLARYLDVMQRDREVEGQRFYASGQTDNTGALTLEIFTANPGQKFTLHRCYVHADGYTWAAPYTGAGSVELQADSAPWAGISLVNGSGQIPTVFSAGRLSAVEAQDGEKLAVVIVGGPVSTHVNVRGTGVLSSLAGNDSGMTFGG